MKRLYKGYVVHSDGRIERKDGNGFLKTNVRTDGYVHIGLGRDHMKRLHTIVWKVFNGKVPDGYEIDHIDNDRTNNSLSNLRLLTKAENISRAKQMLSKEQMELIRYLKSLDWRQVDIAKQIGCSQPLVSRVINGKEYKWNI